MFGLIKKVSFTGLTTLWSVNPLNSILLNATPFKCISMNNQEYKVRTQIVYVNSDGPVFYPFIIKTSKCCGIRNNKNNPYVKTGVPDVMKNLNVRVFNLMSRTNETRHK